MISSQSTPRNSAITRRAQGGFSLVELMISIVISLMILLALIAVFVNINRTNSEMARTNSQIENGRFAMQLLQADLVHAGFWAGYVPQFDDYTSSAIPSATSVVGGSVPTGVPAPCLTFNVTNWTSEYKGNLIGMPVQAYTTIPAGCAVAPALLTNQKANTDVLVVRHLETCEAGVGSCDNTAGKLYFQAPFCEADLSGSPAQGGSANTITLATTASTTDDFYVGMTIRILAGPGAGQSRTITAYNGITKIATVSVPWVVLPTGFSIYVSGEGFILDTAGHTYTRRNCNPLQPAPKRKFISSIYYVRDYASTVGDGIPTLVRSQLDLVAGAIAHQPAVPLIEGVDGLKVEFGIDNISDSGAVTNYNQAVAWANATALNSPTNRGDGSPDGTYVHCATATGCDAALAINAVAAKLFLLVRTTEPSPGYVDNKTYYLDSENATAVEPCVDSTNTALTGAALTACRSYKRHVFSTTVRLTNISGRRETP